MVEGFTAPPLEAGPEAIASIAFSDQKALFRILGT